MVIQRRELQRGRSQPFLHAGAEAWRSSTWPESSLRLPALATDESLDTTRSCDDEGLVGVATIYLARMSTAALLPNECPAASPTESAWVRSANTPLIASDAGESRILMMLALSRMREASTNQWMFVTIDRYGYLGTRGLALWWINRSD
jgi:hypothetical protein